MTDSDSYRRLLAPGTIAGVTIPNRIVQVPMGTGMIDHGRVGDRDIAFQEERASAGVGLIITGASPVHPTSAFAGRILTEAWDIDGVDGLRRRVDAVHRYGTKIFGQILHLGREASGETQPGGTEFVPLAPSAIASPRDSSPPHEMTLAEVRMIIDAFGASADNFKAAGYDGIEIQACHGYLAAQFMTRSSNRRTDRYRGDTLEGRMRFLVEVIEEVRMRCGAGYPVGVRLNAEDLEPGGLTFDDALEIVDALRESAPADYLSITTGARGAYVKDTTFQEGFARDFAGTIKQRVDVPVIVAGRFRMPEVAEEALAAGQADFIGLGRALLADPAWVTKVREGRVAEIRPCIGCLQDCRRSVGLIGCTVHARTGRELEWGPLRDPAAEKRRVVVAGGGPGGLETARVAAEAGHVVVLFEKSGVLGGQLRVAAAGPTRAELLDFVLYAERELARLGVDVRTGVAATKAAVLAEAPDLVVCATGASPLPAAFPVGADARVVTVWDLLGGAVDERPERAVVVDDGAGFWHGVSAAELLADRGANVELVTRARAVALTIPHESAGNTLRRLRGNGVRFRTLVNVTSVSGTRVELADAVTGDPAGATEADLVAVRTTLRSNDELARELEGGVAALALIGDCASPRRLTHAVLEANRAMRRFTAGQLTSSAAVVF